MSDKGRYRCLVKNSVGNEFSHEAFLIVSKLVMCSSTLGNGLGKHEHVQTNITLICTLISLWYLSAEPPTPTPGALRPTDQLAYCTGFQYPSPQQLFSESVQRYQTFVPSQPGIAVRSQLDKTDL